MLMMRSLIIFICISSFCSIDIFAQIGVRPVTIDVQYNSNGEPVFYAVNSSNIPYTVTVHFSNLQFTLPRPRPHIATVKPGRSKLTTLERSGLQDGAIRFRYRYSYNLGCHETKPDEDIEYLLPIAEGKETTAYELTHIAEYIKKESRGDFYGLSFSANHGDTIFAARRGIVGRYEMQFEDEEVSKNYTTKENNLEVIHEDCTFGQYKILKKGSLLVNPGERVEAGQPLAVVPPNENPSKEHFRFLVIYRNPNPDELENRYWKYVKPVFRTSVLKSVSPENGVSYKAVHPEEVITKEMSRRERRRWRRSQ